MNESNVAPAVSANQPVRFSIPVVPLPSSLDWWLIFLRVSAAKQQGLLICGNLVCGIEWKTFQVIFFLLESLGENMSLKTKTARQDLTQDSESIFLHALFR